MTNPSDVRWKQAEKRPDTSVTEFLQDKLEEEVLEVKSVEFVAYAAVRRNHEEVRAVICPYTVTGNRYGMPAHLQAIDYQLVPEDVEAFSGKKPTECPRSILNRLTPTDNPAARTWRKRVRERLREKEERPTLEEGDLVILDHFQATHSGHHGHGTTFTVRKDRRATRFEDSHGVHKISGYTKTPVWVIDGPADVDAVLQEAKKAGALCAALEEQARRIDEYPDTDRWPSSVPEILNRKVLRESSEQALKMCEWALENRPDELTSDVLQSVFESASARRVCMWALKYCPEELRRVHVQKAAREDSTYPIEREQFLEFLREAGSMLAEELSVCHEDLLPFLRKCDGGHRVDVLVWMEEHLNGTSPREAIVPCFRVDDVEVQLQAVSTLAEYAGLRAALRKADLAPLLESGHRKVRRRTIRLVGQLSDEAEVSSRGMHGR